MTDIDTWYTAYLAVLSSGKDNDEARHYADAAMWDYREKVNELAEDEEYGDCDEAS